MIRVYAHKRCVEAVAFCDGLNAIGQTAVIRNVADHSKGQVAECDAIVLSGLRHKGLICRDSYAAKGIPAIVMDYGYIARVMGRKDWQTKHWQVGWGGLNNPPAYECPPDRFERLGVDLQEPTDRDGIVLVLGQHSGDPSHGYTDDEMQAWAQRMCDDHGAYWRPHPASPNMKVDAPSAAAGPLSEWLPRAKRVHAICSTGGLEALMAGVPAVAERPERAVWGDLSGFEHPGREAVARLCHRLAYGQWTMDEMRSGEAPAYLLANRERWNG